jgi:hypothetical protein
MMQAVIFALILIAILVSITCGVWVAIALIKAISTRRPTPPPQHEANQQTRPNQQRPNLLREDQTDG